MVKINLDLKLIELNDGPDGLRSRGSPIMSRVLYQAELQALRNQNILSVKNVIGSNSTLHNSCLIASFGKLRSFRQH